MLTIPCETARSAVLAFCFSCVLLGCGGSSVTPSGAGGQVASHGGNVMALPRDGGLVELVFQPIDAKAKGAKAKGKVVAFFTALDGAGPPPTSPRDVAFTDENGKRYSLTASSAEASGPMRFESPEVTLPSATELNGRLTGTVGAETFDLVNRPR